MATTIGQILVNEALPEKFRDYSRTLGADELEDLLARIIKEDPQAFREASFKLMQLGAKAAYDTGTTLKLSDLEPPADNTALYAQLDKAEEAIRRNPKLTDAQKQDQLEDLYDKMYSAMKEEAYEKAYSRGNNFAMQVKSKARGNKDQLSAMINTPGVYKDPKGRTVPLFIRHSFADGLTPAEYWAGSYGARTGVVSTKFATANAGALGKLFSSAAIEQVVTEDDCGTIAGMPVKADDKDNLGSVLAQDIGDFKAGTVITKQVMADLKKANIEDILVRSPVTCNAKRGVCSHCAGIRENGKFPEIGYNLGLNSASALAERIAQGSLNVKHSGKKIEGASQYSGFDMLKQMATVPKTYKDRATVSEIDGRVERIEKAPQGGSYVWVNDEKHYVPSGYDILVKPGDEVEAGDQLSDGVISPADAVRLKGIGEGRRYFTQRFTQAYRDSGYKGNRRNVESIARALINNVVVDTEDSEGQMLPGDEVTYSRWAWGFKPRQGSVQSTPRQAVGKYLEQPALHYTIGTRVTKKVADELEKFKVPSVLYNEAPPGVHPEMRSIVETTGQTDDWMGRLGTTYIGKRLIEDVQQGAESNSQGLNPYPAVAKGTTLGQWGTPGHKNEPFHY
jgi:DNA-directed RNA polymerase subunit beta'